MRIGDRFGVEMSLRSLFDHPTVTGMAAEVERLLVADLVAMSDDDAARLVTMSSPAPSCSSRDERLPAGR